MINYIDLINYLEMTFDVNDDITKVNIVRSLVRNYSKRNSYTSLMGTWFESSISDYNAEIDDPAFLKLVHQIIATIGKQSFDRIRKFLTIHGHYDVVKLFQIPSNCQCHVIPAFHNFCFNCEYESCHMKPEKQPPAEKVIESCCIRGVKLIRQCSLIENVFREHGGDMLYLLRIVTVIVSNKNVKEAAVCLFKELTSKWMLRFMNLCVDSKELQNYENQDLCRALFVLLRVFGPQEEYYIESSTAISTASSSSSTLNQQESSRSSPEALLYFTGDNNGIDRYSNNNDRVSADESRYCAVPTDIEQPVQVQSDISSTSCFIHIERWSKLARNDMLRTNPLPPEITAADVSDEILRLRHQLMHVLLPKIEATDKSITERQSVKDTNQQSNVLRSMANAHTKSKRPVQSNQTCTANQVVNIAEFTSKEAKLAATKIINSKIDFSKRSVQTWQNSKSFVEIGGCLKYVANMLKEKLKKDFGSSSSAIPIWPSSQCMNCGAIGITEKKRKRTKDLDYTSHLDDGEIECTACPGGFVQKPGYIHYQELYNIYCNYYYFQQCGINFTPFMPLLNSLTENQVRDYDTDDDDTKRGKLYFHKMTLFVVHLIYLFSDYGVHSLSRDLFLPEFKFLSKNLDEVLLTKDADLLGECIHCLVILGYNSQTDDRNLVLKVNYARDAILKAEADCGYKGTVQNRNDYAICEDYHSSFAMLVGLSSLDLKTLQSFSKSRVFRIAEMESKS